MADLELRLVRYFVAVAEHRNFLRAAGALHVAQPSLSRQVRRLEQQLGVRLFDRTPQESRLTAAGEVFLPRARALLVPADHRLAGQEPAGLDDIAGEPVPRVPDETWNAFWRVDPRPDGSRAPEGPFVSGLEDKLELIAAGQAVAIVPATVPEGLLRPDLALIPLRTSSPATSCWPPGPATAAASV